MLFNTCEIVSARYQHYTFLTPTPYPHPMDSVETIKAQFLWSLNIALGEEGGGDMDLKKDSTAFYDITCESIELKLCYDCPKDFCPWL